MAGEVGTIAVSVKLDDKEAVKQLDKLRSKISELQQALSEKKAERDVIASQMVKAQEEAEKAKQRVLELQSAIDNAPSAEALPGLKEQLSAANADLREQEKHVRQLQADYNKITTEIGRGEARLKSMETGAATFARQVAHAEEETVDLNSALSHGNTILEAFTKRFLMMARRVFVFSVILRGLRALRDDFVATMQTVPALRSEVARLQAALLTLAQPIVNVLVPALTGLISLLADLATAAASVVSALFGGTLKGSASAAESLWREKQALTGVGKAAKEASKPLASFDEINRLESGSSGSSGGASASGIVPDFSAILDDSKISEVMQKILKYVTLIGAGLALWKIAPHLGEDLDSVAGKLGKVAGGVGLLLISWTLLSDAWKKIQAEGLNLENFLEGLAGLLAGGLGISILTGSWIPLLISGIAGLLAYLAIATGHGEELINGVAKVVEGLGETFKAVASGDIPGAVNGIKKVLEGLKEIVFALINGVKDTILNFLSWLDEKTGGRFSGIIGDIKKLVEWAADFIKQNIDGITQVAKDLLDFFGAVFTGDWDKAWGMIEDRANGFITFMQGIWEGDFQKTLDGFLQMFGSFGELLLKDFESIVNLIIRGVNWVIGKINTLSVPVPDFLGGGTFGGFNFKTLPEWHVPRLATGAVIPPNREFMAVLGDQSSGTNIETPEALMRQIVREEAGQYMVILSQILSAIQAGKTMTVDGMAFARVVADTYNTEASRRGTSEVKLW